MDPFLEAVAVGGIESAWIHAVHRIVTAIPVQVQPAGPTDRVRRQEAPDDRIVIPLLQILQPGAIREYERESGASPAPIIALTASALTEDAQRSLEAGCTAHVTKPVRKATLIAAIETHAGTRAPA